jgi:hypothetical protein
MDLLSVFRTFRRHWLVAIPVIILTLIGVGWAILLRTPDFEATARLALLPQAAVPRTASGEVIAETDRGQTFSPLSRFNDLAIVVDLVANSISGGNYREALVEKGANPDYEVRLDPASAVAVFAARAQTADEATTTLQLVFDAFEDELLRIQEEQGVDPDFMITTMTIQEPGEAVAKPSSSVRLALAIAGVGMIACFGVVSLAEARRQSKEERRSLESTDEPTEIDGAGAEKSGSRPGRSEDLTLR